MAYLARITGVIRVVFLMALLVQPGVVWSKKEFAGIVAKNAPDSYVVRKGDTLWDIAGLFLEEPWRWPEVWKANPDIENPHLIYPGDVIYLSYDKDGSPVLSMHRGNGSGGDNSFMNRKAHKLSPRVRSYPADKPIPTIPLHVIGPFLNKSRVVSKTEADTSPKIVALDEDHLVVGAGDRIYVQGLTSKNRDDIYSVMRINKTYLHPKTKKNLGVEGLILGTAKLEHDASTASLILTNSKAEIKIGDKIFNTPQRQVSPYFVPKAPYGVAEGQIISVFGGVNQIGQYQVVVITGGHDQGRDRGDVLSVYQTQKDMPSRFMAEDKKIKFPALKIGKLIVFRIFDKVSYALVVNAQRPIYLLDEVSNP